ncbi:hypothetical protein Misp01_45980 [Microtetraspora sp. NBRC 13810]|uniref:hypothetical protein n=1 Tax=Microtetraspora sp. NBRC 13810 TaxID=3030990 RepID=UPI0024A5FFDC|nr:hypothetical protein [Microtetraspora sp. NBRC 13810]GLW09469.1 hypothetical protein Misp01_45980 [Microtetraspora sp. NBRC 13810]
MNNDRMFRDGARVLDEDLAGRASTAGADALLTEILALEPAPARRRILPSPRRPYPRRALPSPRRALLGTAVAAVLTGAFVLGPSLLRTSEEVYAGQAVTIDRVGDEYAFYFTEGDPDPAELEKAFREVGLDNLTVKLIPVSPRQQSPVFGFEKTDPDAKATFTGGDCSDRIDDCLTAFSVTADIKGPAEVRLGRPAKPGEKYAYPADAGWPGEAMAGVRLRGLPAAEAARLVREHGLKVTYDLDWPLRDGGHGVEFEQNVPVSRIDPGWTVATADSYNDGVIVLHVVPGPDATPPPGF